MEVYGQSGYIIAENASVIRVRNNETVTARTRTLDDIKVDDNPFSYFASVIRKKRSIPLYGPYSLENNMMVVRILEAAKQSAKKGKVVPFVPSTIPETFKVFGALHNK